MPMRERMCEFRIEWNFLRENFFMWVLEGDEIPLVREYSLWVFEVRNSTHGPSKGMELLYLILYESNTVVLYISGDASYVKWLLSSWI